MKEVAYMRKQNFICPNTRLKFRVKKCNNNESGGGLLCLGEEGVSVASGWAVF